MKGTIFERLFSKERREREEGGREGRY